MDLERARKTANTNKEEDPANGSAVNGAAPNDGNLGTGRTLPELKGDINPITLGDWLVLISPVMKDLTPNSSKWWDHTKAAAEHFYTKWRGSSPLDRVYGQTHNVTVFNSRSMATTRDEAVHGGEEPKKGRMANGNGRSYPKNKVSFSMGSGFEVFAVEGDWKDQKWKPSNGGQTHNCRDGGHQGMGRTCAKGPRSLSQGLRDLRGDKGARSEYRSSPSFQRNLGNNRS